MTLLRDLIDISVARHAPEQPVFVTPRPAGRRRLYVPPVGQAAPVAEPATDTERPRPRPQRHSADGGYREGFFSSLLNQADGRPEPVRVHPDELIHVSDLVQFCGRAHVLAQQESAPLQTGVTGGHRVMWAIGRAIEDHVRQGIIRERNYRNIFGRWSCSCRGHTLTGELDGRPPTCSVCGTIVGQYEELELTDSEVGIVGRPDLIYRVGERRFVPLEIKSMAAEAWNALRAPLADHVFQVLCYARLLQADGVNTVNDAVIIYVSKDFRWGSPYKEFRIPVAPGPQVDMVNQVWREVRAFRDATRQGQTPARTCSRLAQGRARACPLAETCFMRP